MKELNREYPPYVVGRALLLERILTLHDGVKRYRELNPSETRLSLIKRIPNTAEAEVMWSGEADVIVRSLKRVEFSVYMDLIEAGFEDVGNDVIEQHIRQNG